MREGYLPLPRWPDAHPIPLGILCLGSQVVILCDDGPRALVRRTSLHLGALRLARRPRQSAPVAISDSASTLAKQKPLVPLEDQSKGARWRLEPLETMHGQDLSPNRLYFLGRHPGCDLVVEDDTVSSFHCALMVQGDWLLVSDLRSKNGTRLDGAEIAIARTQRQARLEVGSRSLSIGHREALTTHLCRLPSAAMAAVEYRLARYATASEPVLLCGPTGSGKEGLAHKVHTLSGRRGAWVALNAATLRYETAASELFGHVRGAFTGADRNVPGAFRLADGGTLFLDEIGDLSLSVQGDLLRAIQEKRVRPRGSSKEVAVDTRLVCATHHDLSAMVQEGTFRQDLFHRLSVLPVEVPPLACRPEDIDVLIDFLLAREFPGYSVTPKARHALVHGHWPGNIRQLFAVLRRSVLTATHNPLRRQDIRGLEPVVEGEVLAPGQGMAKSPPLSQRQKQARLLYTLKVCGGDIRETARRLGIHRATVYRYLERMGKRIGADGKISARQESKRIAPLPSSEEFR